jgi:integrator complex subunit 9
MLALPYLTKMKGFRAPIYCTEPVMQFGKMLMEELTHYVKSSQTIMLNNNHQEHHQMANETDKKKYPLFRTLEHLAIQTYPNGDPSENCDTTATNDKDEDDDDCLPPPSKLSRPALSDVSNENENEAQLGIESLMSDFKLKNYAQLATVFNITEPNMKPINWRYLYSKEDVELCMSKIKLVGFNERVSVFGSLIVTPKSSGHSIGSCNWTVDSDCDTISYLSRSSLLSTHSKLFNPLILKQQIVDCAIVTGLNQASLHDPEQMIQDFCKACIVTVKNQGNVLIPVLPCTGKIYDLIECLYRYLADAQLTHIPVYFISQVAQQSLSFANIFAEWLNDAKQSLVNAAEAPFQHGELAKANLLKVYPSINAKFNDDFNQPCILFASHPSLRFGESCHFVELWKNSPANSFIFTDPEFNYLDALAPFQPVYANFYYFPIDTTLNSHQAHKLFKETKQLAQLVLSSQYKQMDTSSQPLDPNFSRIDPSRLAPSTELNYYGPNDIIKLSLKRRFENCEIEAELAAMIMPTKRTLSLSKDLNDLNLNGGNVAFTTFNAQIVTKNNAHVLKAAPKTIPLMLTKRARINETNLKRYTYGKINVEHLLKVLRASGLNQVKLIESDGGESTQVLIAVDGTNRLCIEPSTNRVNVYCDNDDIRNKIKDSLLKCLKTL